MPDCKEDERNCQKNPVAALHCDVKSRMSFGQVPGEKGLVYNLVGGGAVAWSVTCPDDDECQCAGAGGL